MQAHYKQLETQLAQFSQSTAQRQSGHLPSQPSQSNPPRDTVNAIVLRSGSTYDGPQMPIDDAEVEGRESNDVVIQNNDP